MRFAVLGTGGVGGYFGGKLAQAGEDVTFIARGKNLEAMQTSGLRVDSIQGDFLLERVQVTDSPESLRDVDVILLATKAWQLDSAIESIKTMVGEQTTVLPTCYGVA